jgi:autophagy-related protein 2
MTFFFPSSFQKRLLKYALTRLDLIETDDLNLDDLGLTFGQRSVVELKNVSIKISRIAERANLPPSIQIDHASIRLLRLTVPADLHASGILVEVEGVDIRVRLLSEDQVLSTVPARKQEAYGPSHTDRANRPRIHAPRSHDPGGTLHRHGSEDGVEISKVLPTSRDLAASFLESEPIQEKQELEATLASRSRMYESAVSSSSYGDEGDVGLGTGFALPSFVASFFQGVADRLAVTIKDVSITLQLALSTDEADNVSFVLSIGGISVHAVSSSTETNAAENTRKIAAQAVKFCMEADRDMFSEASSPRLGKMSSVLSSRCLRGGGPSSPSRSSTSDSRSIEQTLDLSASVTESRTSRGLGYQQATCESIAGSEIFENTASGSLFPEVDNKAFAEMHASPGPPSPESERASSSSNEAPQMAESQLFSHDEAESMYMSALSSGMPAMPGAWDSSQHAQQQYEDQPQYHDADAGQGSPIPEEVAETTPRVTPRSQSPEIPLVPPPATLPPASQQSDLSTDTKPKALIQICSLESISVIIPGDLHSRSSDGDNMAGHRLPTQSMRSSVGKFPTGPEASLAYSTMPPQPLEQPQSHGQQVNVEAGTLEIDTDMRTLQVLVRITQALLLRMPSVSTMKESKVPERAKTSPLHTSARLESLRVNFRESSSIQLERSLPSQAGRSSIRDEPLICLSLSSIEFLQQGHKQRSLTITKVAVRHASTEVLWFIDAVNVRDSLIGSTTLRTHDLSVVMTQERVEIQVKPVHFVLDLLVIDEVLSRSGGLSSLINLGNSISSTATAKKSQSPAKKASAPRTVRFSEPQQRPRAKSDPTAFGSKVNLRIGGSVIDLVGSESSMQVKSTAIKLAWRDGQARIVIDGVGIEGPLLPNSKAPAGIQITAKALDIRFLDVPEENDLDRLLSLITPSSDRYDKEDDIMVDTLVRQRRKGAVLRLNVGEIKTHTRGLDWQLSLTKLADEISKLSSVAKYLPEDDRPGMLTFILVKKLDFRIDLDKVFGPLVLKADLIEGAQISVPSLTAAQISSWTLARGNKDVLIGEVLSQGDSMMGAPMLMCRFVADEMEPTVRLKLSNTCFEYKVATVVALTELFQRLGRDTASPPPLSQQTSPSASTISEDTTSSLRKIRLSTEFRDSAIALHPLGSPAKGLFVLTNAVIGYDTHKKNTSVSLELKKASLLIINNTEVLGEGVNNADQKIYFDQNDQIQQLAKHGFVPVGSMSAASAVVRISKILDSDEQQLDVEFRNNLLFLETCADSTQTLIQILSGLSPPTPPSPKAKYRTEVVPITDMLASFTGNAFVSEPGPELGLQTSRVSMSTVDEEVNEDEYDDGGYLNDLYAEDDEMNDRMTASYVESEAQSMASLHIAPVNLTAPDEDEMAQSMMAHSMLDFRSDHFDTKVPIAEGTAHRWDSTKNTYGLASDKQFKTSPLKVRIRDVHIIWNLFDGYDWQATRDTISHAVQEMEAKAMMRRPRSSTRSSDDEESEDIIGDVLFNSIYISIPAGKDARDLTNAINHEIDDMASETGSYATSTTVTATPSRRQSGTQFRPKKLKLNRSRQHKMSFEFAGVSADIIALPPESGEVQSSVDVRVKKLEIFDNLPTSTWKKFATYMHEAGEREVDTSMVHLELLNVRPVADLDASEIVMKLTLLPLRLHVDQDALDFLTRFFEFKDDSVSPSIAPSAPPFIQRAEVNPVRLRLDYKPKKVDYAALRSGRTTEFMNFIILDRADMTLRRVILYGVSGFDRLGLMLNNIWSPDVRRNQLGTVLSALAPVRPLIDVASGVRDLVAVPIREYRKDGRIVRSIQKGAIAFAKTTSTELVNLGAKLAIGTQTILQNAEHALVDQPQSHDSDDEKKQISLYADQPLGIVQGLRGAYASLERDLLLARDAIVAVPGEVMASESATDAVGRVVKMSPTIILRPAMGVSKAVGQTLLGAGNTMDRGRLRGLEDVSILSLCCVMVTDALQKYKRH